MSTGYDGWTVVALGSQPMAGLPPVVSQLQLCDWLGCCKARDGGRGIQTGQQSQHRTDNVYTVDV